MNLLTPDTLVPVLNSAGLLLALSIPSLLFYGYVMDWTALGGQGGVRREWFGRWDALAAGAVALFFMAVVMAKLFGPSPVDDDEPSALPNTRTIVLLTVQTEILFVSIVAGIAVVMKIGGSPWRTALGLSAYPFGKAIGWAVLLLLLAYPLIIVSFQLWTVLIASVGFVDDSKQDAVRFLAESKSQTSRLVVAAQAVLLAPAQEELIFRGCLYGVAKRYLGAGAGLILSATLFAGIHLHLPSFAGLFMLAVCLTLAYEWTGSVFVPMAMHALFNLTSVIALFQ